MATAKKTAKSKLITENINAFMNQSQFLKDSPKGKKTQKRQKIEAFEEEDNNMSKLIGQYETSMKKKKAETNIEGTSESRQKILDLVGHQLEARKQCNEKLFECLSEITTKAEADYNTMKENEQKLEHLTGTYMKCIQQATTAYKQKLKALKELHTSFQKEVEGLLARGAMKPDDRPLWFDVYRAFPPLVEPKFARAKPEIKPIRQIFYKEDVIRAEFHSKGHGLGAVNMLAQSNDSQTKRLVQQYEKLKAEGVPNDELIEKSATAVGIERKEQYESAIASKSAKLTPENPNSVTAQVLAEADLKNIFKE